MRRCASAYDAVTDVIAPPCCARPRVGAAQQLDLARLLDGLGQRSRSCVDAGASRRGRSATVRAAAAPAARRGRRRVGRGDAAPRATGRRCARSRSCRRARRGARRRGRGRTRAPRPARRRSGRSTSGDPRRTPRRSRRRHAVERRLLESSTAGTVWFDQRSRSDVAVDASCWFVPDVPSRRRGAYRKRMPLAPGLTASVTLVVDDADTALALRSGDVPVLGTPRLVALAEEATVAGARRASSARGRTTVGYQVQLAHLTPTAGRRHGGRRGDARAGRGPPAHVPGVGERRPRPGRRRAGSPASSSSATGSSSARRSKTDERDLPSSRC